MVSLLEYGVGAATAAGCALLLGFVLGTVRERIRNGSDVVKQLADSDDAMLCARGDLDEQVPSPG